MCIKATIVAYAFLVQCFENATIVAYAGIRVNYACYQAFINNNLFTQRNSCIGRLQVEKCASIFLQA